MAKVLTRQEKTVSFIYAIKAIGTNRYKIGTTTDLKGRLAGVQTGCPYPAQIVATWEGDRRLETAIHRELADVRKVGEWFEVELKGIQEAVGKVLGAEKSKPLPPPITVATEDFEALAAEEAEIQRDCFLGSLAMLLHPVRKLGRLGREKMVKQRQAAVVAYLRRRSCKVEPSDREVVESNWPITKSAMREYLHDLNLSQVQGQGSG